MQRGTDKNMGNREQTILLVSNDAILCAEVRREFDAKLTGVRVAAVSSINAARRIVQEDAPAAILLQEESVAEEAEGPRGLAPTLEAVVASLAVYAPVVVVGLAEKHPELSALIDAGAADYVRRDGGSLRAAMQSIKRHLHLEKHEAVLAPERFENGEEDFGEVLRHELNNPLTGILGNAELLLAEIHRKNDGKLPLGGEQRLETIAALAVRLRETVRRLSLEWEARQHPVH
jgi:signal transduction histidine kinase